MSRAALKTHAAAPPIIDMKPGGEIVAVQPGVGHNSAVEAVSSVAKERLRSIVSRIERLDEEIKALNADKSDVYREAKAAGFEPAGLRAAVRWMRDPAASEERDTVTKLYVDALMEAAADETVDTASRARARARARGPA